MSVHDCSPLIEILVPDERAARRLRFLGPATIRVGGVDSEQWR